MKNDNTAVPIRNLLKIEYISFDGLLDMDFKRNLSSHFLNANVKKPSFLRDIYDLSHSSAAMGTIVNICMNNPACISVSEFLNMTKRIIVANGLKSSRLNQKCELVIILSTNFIYPLPKFSV